MMVPNDQCWWLLAAFNSGFIYSDTNNGSLDNGRINEPLAAKATPRSSAIAMAASRSSGGVAAPMPGPNVAWGPPEPAADHLERNDSTPP